MTTRISAFFPLLFITLICVGGVEVFYLGVERYVLDPALQDGGEKNGAPAMEQVASEKVIARQPANPAIITKRNLFGPPPTDTKATESAAKPVAEELEPTTLEIVLMGTIDGGEDESRAIILNKRDRKQEMYRDGDVVQGAVIKEIQRGVVILTLDGKDEKLDMSEASKYAQNTPSQAARRVVGPRGNISTSRFIRPAASSNNQNARGRVVRPLRRIVRPAAIDQDAQDSTVEPPVDEAVQDTTDQEAVDQDTADQNIVDQDTVDQDATDQEITDQQDIPEQDGAGQIVEQQ